MALPGMKLKDNGDGTAMLIDEEGFPISLNLGDSDEPERLVVSLEGFAPVSVSGPATRPADAEAALTEGQFRQTLASTEGGRKILRDPGRYAEHLARGRAEGLVAEAT